MQKILREISLEKTLMQRFNGNPLVEAKDIPWEKSLGEILYVFNPGVIEVEKGFYIMLFRASGNNNQSMSSLGLAWSDNGIKWNIFNKPVLPYGVNQWCPLGIEDPRIVKWNNWYYIFATAYIKEGCWRIGIWRTKNFLKYEWVGIPFDWDDKDASIIPRSFSGWIYLLHRRYRGISISSTQDPELKGVWHYGGTLLEPDSFYTGCPTLNTQKIGIAGPPIETLKGWFQPVHVVTGERRENKVYSLGAALLEKEDPTKVKGVYPYPLLWPTEEYEINGGVNDVVFSNGAAFSPDERYLNIYYGAADKSIGLAFLDIEELLKWF